MLIIGQNDKKPNVYANFIVFLFFLKFIKINSKIEFSNTNLKNSNTRDKFQIVLEFVKKIFLKKHE